MDWRCTCFRLALSSLESSLPQVVCIRAFPPHSGLFSIFIATQNPARASSKNTAARKLRAG